MDQFVIEGGRPLRGEVEIGGSKNAALPILIATLLTDEPCRLDNVPTRLRDIRTTIRLLESLGKTVAVRGGSVLVSSAGSLKTQAPYEIVKQMRASVLAAGPLLARFGLVRVPIPGGCAIGLRPIDIHLKAFRELGAREIADHGDVILSAAPQLAGGRVRLRFPSVGATEHVMLAAAATPARTIIDNAAREPEIADLAAFLVKLGAKVGGAGGSRVVVEGQRRLRGARHRVMADRIEAGTFLIACAAAGGRLRLRGARGADLAAVIAALKRAGAAVSARGDGLEIEMRGRPRPVSIATAPYPGFPTDLQAPWMALMALASGASIVSEAVFENRFMHAAELGRMGASIGVSGAEAAIAGVARLTGAPVMACDLRAGAALVIAALAAKGRTTVQRVYHIDRGYERLERKLCEVGGRVRRVKR
ncbi:MAG: UDP-N-acetylglucosamine 1-carboxyvinyltransferase [Elusimicrobia bacterium]|nr:UDP-N-acetylglucosamine 1-carboxyvinyltransferase [Elusimicrobiota bacterium]MDE2426635.1 UDP-N-acetylglucosamine 1-carboxyvinyltransferase [Elusimicrobiota bacterium]